jgi:hypothetical protein
MSRKQFIVKRGGKLTVGLPVASAADAAKQLAGALSQQPGGVLPTEELDDLYVFRKGGIRFYDLGTRKNEDGSFRDTITTLIIEPTGSGAGSDYYHWYHNSLLDDFDPDTCLQIPQGAEFLYFDASFVTQDGDANRHLIGNVDKRPYVNDLASGVNVEETIWKSGKLKFAAPDSDTPHRYLSIESAFYYNSFCTQDDDATFLDSPFFKVTTEPVWTADPVSYIPTGKDRVYLTPVRTLRSTGFFPNHVYLGRRMPILPNFEPQHDPMIFRNETIEFFVGGGLFGDMLTRMTASSSLWSAVLDHYTTVFLESGIDAKGVFGDGDSSGEPTAFFVSWTAFTLMNELNNGLDPMVAPSYLVAIIVQGDQRLYVWRNYVINILGNMITPSFPLFERRWSRIYKP